jgi:hypothetical protein
LDQQVEVTENGRRRKRSKAEVAIVQLANKAASGDMKASRRLPTSFAKLASSTRRRWHRRPSSIRGIWKSLRLCCASMARPTAAMLRRRAMTAFPHRELVTLYRSHFELELFDAEQSIPIGWGCSYTRKRGCPRSCPRDRIRANRSAADEKGGLRASNAASSSGIMHRPIAFLTTLGNATTCPLQRSAADRSAHVVDK